eukprot:scaffold375_cov378-Prasinococcus_capsulatus_cf.AAC.23
MHPPSENLTYFRPALSVIPIATFFSSYMLETRWYPPPERLHLPRGLVFTALPLNETVGSDTP